VGAAGERAVAPDEQREPLERRAERPSPRNRSAEW
jgi:hypothetical protein